MAASVQRTRQYRPLRSPSGVLPRAWQERWMDELLAARKSTVESLNVVFCLNRNLFKEATTHV
jgi:hypothetical protein